MLHLPRPYFLPRLRRPSRVVQPVPDTESGIVAVDVGCCAQPQTRNIFRTAASSGQGISQFGDRFAAWPDLADCQSRIGPLARCDRRDGAPADSRKNGCGRRRVSLRSSANLAAATCCSQRVAISVGDAAIGIDLRTARLANASATCFRSRGSEREATSARVADFAEFESV